jgi:hypothetical protein
MVTTYKKDKDGWLKNNPRTASRVGPPKKEVRGKKSKVRNKRVQDALARGKSKKVKPATKSKPVKLTSKRRK